MNNDWIPTEAVRSISGIREKYNGEMSETCVSQILYELNMIWRAIMRKECEAIKKKLTGQIQDLRRQVVTKQAFDKGELQKEITSAKRELGFATKKLAFHRMGKSASEKDNVVNDDLQRSIRMLESVQG